MTSFSLHPVTSAQGTFCGKDRRSIVEQITREVAKIEPFSSGIYGGRRMGKSSILYEIQERFTHEYKPEDACIVVGYIDLGVETPNTKKQLFHSIYSRLLSSTLDHCRGSSSEELNQFWRHCDLNSDNRDPNLAFIDFSQAYETLIKIILSQYADVRVIIMLDEIEHLANRPWSTEISANLKAFLTNQQYCCFCNKTMLIIGSTTKNLSRLMEKRGSPLENELEIFPLSVFTEEDTRELVTLYPHGEVNNNAVQLIYKLSGGHPMIIQYILKKLSETSKSLRNADDIEKVAHSFPETKSIFQNWVDDFLPLDRCLYRKLAESPVKLSKDQLRNVLKTDEIDDALHSLTYTGVAEKNHDNTYSVAGIVFKDWFMDHGYGKEETELTQGSLNDKGPNSSRLVVSAILALVIFAVTIGVLVFAANLVSGPSLIFIVIVGILFDLVSIVFVLVVNNVITSTQAMNFYDAVLNKVPALRHFLQRGKDETP